MVKRRLLVDEDWTTVSVRASEATRELLKKLVQFHIPEARVTNAHVPGRQRSFGGGCCVTQVCAEVFNCGGSVERMTHEPLGFVTGQFKGVQPDWLTVNKRDYPLVATFHRQGHCYGARGGEGGGFTAITAIWRKKSVPGHAGSSV